MAKKKKEKDKNIAVSTVVAGNVTIKVMKGKRVVSTQNIHNVGTLDLFYGLISSMSGNVNVSCIPRYIGVGKGTATVSDDVVLLKGLIDEYPIVRPELITNFGGPYKSELNHTVSGSCQGVIPYSMISVLPITEVGLFGTVDTSTLLARVEIAETRLSPGQSLLVEWTLSLENKTQGN